MAITNIRMAALILQNSPSLPKTVLPSPNCLLGMVTALAVLPSKLSPGML